MELNGLKVCFLGDSITEGCCAASPELGYVNVLKELCGFAEAYNHGIGGTRIARQREPSEEAKYDLDFCQRMNRLEPDADLIIVFGGTNDHGHGDAPFGEASDRTPDTFIGACHYLWKGLLERYPKSKIIVLTPLHRVQEDNLKNGKKLHDYVGVIRETALSYGLPVLDLFERSKIQAHIPAIAQELTTDGLHPNDIGHRILAEEIKAYLEKL